MIWRPNSPYNGGTQDLHSSEKLKAQMLTRKVIVTLFWDREAIFMPDNLQKCKTVYSKYYSNLLCWLKEPLKEKHQEKLQNGVLFLQDKASAHRAGKMMDILENVIFKWVDNSLY